MSAHRACVLDEYEVQVDGSWVCLRPIAVFADVLGPARLHKVDALKLAYAILKEFPDEEDHEG